MNIRVAGIVSIVILFAIISGYMSYSMYSGVGLADAYNKKDIQVIQKTTAGTLPHEVTVKNNGNNSITVRKGETLASSVSQDMVFAEDKTIGPKTEAAVKAYCLEPSKRAKAEAKLLPVNTTYDAVTQVISSSNPSDQNSAMNTQLQIWIIMSGGDLNIYTGEPVALVEEQNLKWNQFRQNVTNEKNNLMSTFNVNEGEISTLKDKDLYIGQSLFDNISNYIKSSLGI